MHLFPRFLFADGKTAEDDRDNLFALAAPVELQAAAAGDAKALRRFEMEAYNGGPMKFWWSDVPVVVDLAGMKIPSSARPILHDHSTSRIVGHTDQITTDGKTLRVKGVVSGAGTVAREVVDSADKGFPWQASIGAEILAKPEQIRAGADVTVNGQTFSGPLAVVRSSRLGEVSFVALGADDSTRARMAAGRNLNHATIKGASVVKNRITLSALLVLAAAYPHLTAALNERAEIADKDDDAAKKGAADLKAWAESEPKPQAKPDQVIKATADDGDETESAKLIKQMRLEAAAESTRHAAIRKACGEKHADIAAKAIGEGWTADRAELEVLRATRPTGPAIHIAATGGVATGDVIEAGLILAARGNEQTLKRYKEQTLEAAAKYFRGDMTLNGIILAAAYANGYTGRARKVDGEVIRAAFALQAGGFSTVDIGGILSNVGNKMLLEGFFGVEQSWRGITSISPATDFKTMTRYRLTAGTKYEKVGPGGEIKHGELGNESWQNKVDTYGIMLGITRQNLIDDDLSALSSVPRHIGRGAGLMLCEVFWAEFLDDATFFKTDGTLKNYIEGATTNLSIAGLNAAIVKFRRQVDAKGNPIGLEPRTLLVPPELEATALEINRSLATNTGGGSSKDQQPNANIYSGRFNNVVSQYLTAAKKWYLFADPRDLAPMDTAFLNGQEAPTVESAQADFSVLGIQMRGYHDFGVAKSEYRAGVKSKGEA